MKKLLTLLMLATMAAGSLPTVDGRCFISHRGVDLHSTIAGENSIEAIELARRAGFGAIETDVRVTADDSLVVMHDPTLNRTCIDVDGDELRSPVEIAHLTWAQLRKGYRLKADSPAFRSQVPSLREYLVACRNAGLLTFIEPKLLDVTGRHYARIIALADEVLGRGNYVITSNNRANDIIRDVLMVEDVRLMGILYQTTFDRVERLGNCIMAVSASRFDDADFDHNIHLSKKAGLECESHADSYARFLKINRNEVDYVSTDLLAPDYSGQGTVVAQLTKADFHDVVVTAELQRSAFGALYLTMDIDGDAEVTMGSQTFVVSSTSDCVHQVVVYNEQPRFSIIPLSGNTTIRDFTLLQVEY